MKLTIKDIAKLANVSPGTVSKVINQSGNLSRQTIEKVKKIIEETGYQPTFSAKALATKKSNLIGLIYAGDINAEMNHPFFNDVVNSFKNAIGNLGYDMLVFSNNKFSKDGRDYLARCIHFQLDGCLIIAGDRIEEATNELDQSDFPCVGIDIALKGPNSSYVTTDNRKVSEAVVTYLYLNRMKEVAFIGGPEDSFVSSIRKDSFIRNMELFGMKVKDEWIQYGDYFEDSGYAAMKRILAASKRPQVVYAVSDMMALGALRALKEKRIRVPEDIKLIGCDDIEACRYSDPPLATVRQDKDKMGKLAAHMLHDLINEEVQPNSVMVDPQLVVRGSCSFDSIH
ncbi:LacI family DNA-binding transcriptional regulator [Virgibacillus dakarensis]|uniref:LacI family transcriptional regulator n=1 Tax=Lentibacillus populi TaxID=1827502 RepID=A0A9W5TWI6_9BACI|nr:MULTISPECIES: LacI family DNA-binding transcriptional regulator [Bacillaceae]MBT2217083.1 LacI family transcriptional regulator [Virgibacillus dakarensis]MTW84679.1 LacI family DNA-binding transcriptional regulator [Virgibacillus dakarensis]GGB36656.1 LacI family transcriptional regulator [Lentibacillus populi]